MSVGVGQIGFTSDMGLLPFSNHFLADENPLLIVVELTDLTVAGSEDPTHKGPQKLNIRIGATVYELPTDVWRRFHPGRKKIIYWRTGSGVEGNFVFFADAPPVF